VGRIGRELGLAITAFQPFRDFEAMPEPQRARNLERAESKFGVMQALGTDLMLVCSNVHPAAIDDAARAAADPPNPRRARRSARTAHRVRSLGLGPARQTLVAGLGDCSGAPFSDLLHSCGKSRIPTGWFAAAPW